MSKMNSSKSQLFLMEFICVVMFFALCAALCVNAFVKSDGISKDGRELNESLMLAQNVAENIKAMDVPEQKKIEQTVKGINEENKKYQVKVSTDMKADMFTADVHVWKADSSKEEICSITVKKYVPGGDNYAK